MEGRQRRSFTDDYKRQAVDLVASSRPLRSDRWPRSLACAIPVLRRWVEQRGAGLEPTAASRRPTTQATLPSADHAAEIARLQRENRAAAHGARYFKKVHCDLCWSSEMTIPLHRRSPRRLSGDDHVRRARRLTCGLL